MAANVTLMDLDHEGVHGAATRGQTHQGIRTIIATGEGFLHVMVKAACASAPSVLLSQAVRRLFLPIAMFEPGSVQVRAMMMTTFTTCGRCPSASSADRACNRTSCRTPSL